MRKEVHQFRRLTDPSSPAWSRTRDCTAIGTQQVAVPSPVQRRVSRPARSVAISSRANRTQHRTLGELPKAVEAGLASNQRKNRPPLEVLQDTTSKVMVAARSDSNRRRVLGWLATDR